MSELRDAEHHLRVAREKLSSPWLRIWGNVRGAVHHLEQAELALNAFKESQGAVVPHLPQR